MKFNGNINHPAPGDRITVDPIRSVEHIKAISKLTKDNPRNHLLFIMSINNGLRIGDIVKLKVKDFKNKKIGDSVNIIERKTGKTNVLVINKAVYKALINYLEIINPDDSDYLFYSRKGNYHLQSQAVSKLVKKWAKDINLTGRYGSHTLRKTFGYIQRTVFNIGFEVLCKRFNHSNPSITMRYVGVTDNEIHNMLMNEVG